MPRKKMTKEERENKKDELVQKMRKLLELVGDVNDLSHSIGMKDKVDNSISLGVFSFRPAIIVEYVNNRFGCDTAQKSRKQEVVFARHVCMHLMKKFTRLSLKEIAEYFNSLDHSTVIHGLRRLQDLIETEETTRMIVAQCENDMYKYYKENLK
jgi:chromosomal replication initiation ATPase DnaA